MTKDRYFKHETALVESESIGSGTRIWAYTHVMSGAVIGENCNICDPSEKTVRQFCCSAGAGCSPFLFNQPFGEFHS